MDYPGSGTARIGNWLRNILRRRKAAPPSSPQPSQGPPQRPVPTEPIPGNYYFFELLIEITVEGVVHLGLPKRAIQDLGKNPPVQVWGTPIELAFPQASTPRMLWIDDPMTGVSRRPLNSPGDWLGAEGMLGGRKYRIEQILDKGKNQVVYSLYNPDTRSRIAYGFPLAIFAGAGPSPI
jgi:hypothetical protein